MNILFAGSPSTSAEILEHLVQNKHLNVSTVLTQPNKRSKRGTEKHETPVSRVAKKHSIKTLKPKTIDKAFISKELGRINIDLILVVAYGHILPKEMLKIPKIMSMNIHFSLLPKYRGASPIQSAIINGDKKTGISFMKIIEKMDAGELIYKADVKIDNEDTKTVLENKLTSLAISKMDGVLNSLQKNDYKLIKQNESDASYCSKIVKEDSLVDFKDSSLDIFNKFRALEEWPGTSFVHNNKVIKIHDMYISNSKSEGNPGEIFKIDPSGITLNTIDYMIVITNLQFPNKKIISSQDAFNSYLDFFVKK